MFTYTVEQNKKFWDLLWQAARAADSLTADRDRRLQAEHLEGTRTEWETNSDSSQDRAGYSDSEEDVDSLSG